MQGQPFPHLRGAAHAAGYGVFIFQPPGGVFRRIAQVRAYGRHPACGAPSLLNSASMSSGSLTR